MSFKRKVTVSPYIPNRVYALGGNNGEFSDKDNGKAVATQGTGSNLVLAGVDAEIFGFIQSVEPYTDQGHSIGGIICDVNAEAYAQDEAGGLVIGDLVVAGSPVGLGTPLSDYAPVKAGTPTTHRWMVVETYGGAAGDRVLLRKV